VVQVIELLPRKCKVLSSRPTTVKREKEEQKKNTVIEKVQKGYQQYKHKAYS
jgi:hypothetical protein